MAANVQSDDVYPILARIDADLQRCRDQQEMSQVLRRQKRDLRDRLLRRFGHPVAEALTVKLLNILVAKCHLKSRSAHLISRPVGLVVDPSNACQLKCPGCVHSARNEALGLFDWPGGTLSEQRFAELLSVYGAYAVGVNLYSYGEPLLNLRTPGLIRRSKAYLLQTAVSTSLSVHKLDAEAYVESGLDLMILAIDGATQGVYERFRRGGNLDLVFGNIRKLVSTRRALRRRTPILCWNFLAFEHNVHEIPTAARMARKLGVDQFCVKMPYSVEWDDPAIRKSVAARTRLRRLDWLSAIARLSRGNDAVPESLDADGIMHTYDRAWPEACAADGTPPKSGHTCHWLYKNMVLDATGRVMPCCGPPSANGGLVFDRFQNDRDSFNSEAYVHARSWLAGSRAAPVDAPACAKCDWDQTNVNIGSREIRRYFRGVGGFGFRSLRLLSEW